MGEVKRGYGLYRGIDRKYYEGHESAEGIRRVHMSHNSGGAKEWHTKEDATSFKDRNGFGNAWIVVDLNRMER